MPSPLGAVSPAESPDSTAHTDTYAMDIQEQLVAGDGPREEIDEGVFYDGNDSLPMMDVDSDGGRESPESDTAPSPIDVDSWRGFPEDPREPDDSSDVVTDIFPDAGLVIGREPVTGFDAMRKARQQEGEENLFYPFSGETEWELVTWLHRAGVSASEVDKLLKLRYVLRRPLSFKSGETMRSQIESLPDPGPRWKELDITPNYGTPVDPITLLYRDPMEAIADLLSRPVFAKDMEFAPRKIWKDVGKTKRIYSEMSTGNWWWRTQESLPGGSTVIPVMLGSDQVHLSVLSGDKKAWPVYLSIGNIIARVRNKPSNGAWMIIAYLPITDFVEDSNSGVLKLRLFHQCMEILLAPLIEPGMRGKNMGDSKGDVRKCYPFVAAYLADHPEQCLVNCNLQNVCPTTLANFRQMGDPTPAAPRTREWILARIKRACDEKDPAVIGPYYTKASSLGISAVNQPFWRNLPRYQPELVIAPDLLHGPGIFWRHHLFMWIKRLIGTDILDQRLRALQPVTGYKSFTKGISHLSQWTGREDRELQRVTVALAAGTVQMTPEILQNIRSFHDFLYLAQYRSHTDTTLGYLTHALAIFHATKHVWVDEEVRYGTKASALMDHFNIPKLAMFHAFARHIPEMGASPQFSTDITEYNHQFMAKTAYKATNRKNYATQMCRFLDRSARLDRQAEFIAWCKKEDEDAQIEKELAQYNQDPELLKDIRSELKALLLAESETPYASLFRRSRLWLKNRPHISATPLLAVSHLYQLEALVAATNLFLSTYAGVPPRPPGSERVKSTDLVDIWKKFRIRLPDILDDEEYSTHIVDARPPSVTDTTNEPYGHCHCVLVHDSANAGPVQIRGYRVAQVRLIFRLSLDEDQPAHLLPLVYVEFFSTPKEVPEKDIFMYKVSRSGSGQRREGSVISIASISRFVQLIPVFGPNADDEPGLNAYTSMAIARDYYVNSFADKQIYQSVY